MRDYFLINSHKWAVYASKIWKFTRICAKHQAGPVSFHLGLCVLCWFIWILKTGGEDGCALLSFKHILPGAWDDYAIFSVLMIITSMWKWCWGFWILLNIHLILNWLVCGNFCRSLSPSRSPVSPVSVHFSWIVQCTCIKYTKNYVGVVTNVVERCSMQPPRRRLSRSRSRSLSLSRSP